MTKPNKKNIRTGFIILLTAFAVASRFIGNLGVFPAFFGIIRSTIYIYLMISWGISARTRIIQVQVRRYLTAVAALSVLWMIFRTVKYYFVPVQTMARPIWYLYYLPMLFIPLLAVFVAMSLGRSENYRLPKSVLLLFIPTALLLLLVLTNDLHQLVFSFPAGKPWTDNDYSYSFCYFLVIGWECVLCITAFAIMVKRCRIRTRMKITPLIFLGLTLCYAVLYYLGSRWLMTIAGDITVVQCCLFTLTFESCIQSGLIQTNTGYDDLFEACTLGVQIADEKYQTQYASRLSPKLSEELMREAEKAPVLLDKNTRIKRSRIPGGHVLWKEDITELTDVTEALEETSRELAERNYLEQENYKTKRRINTLREKNRLLDILQQQTMPQIDLLDRLLLQYESETDEANRRRLLAMTAVVGSYIKRCGNLLFISEGGEATDIAELTRCLEESFSNLELLGVSCGCDLPENETVRVSDAIRAYQIFETVVEASMENLHSIWIKGRNTADDIVLHLEAECETDLSDLSALADGFADEDGVYCFTIRVGKGGERV
ncbi:MAG: histidine kinase N-terminal 7TM domain-containing protein [Acutalibacteraceae bacterium]